MLLEYALTADDDVAFNEHVATTSPAIRKQQAQVRVLATVSAPVPSTRERPLTCRQQWCRQVSGPRWWS
ncbi:hypothetical protein [Xylanimonas oleitrophica]|uniref:hypothetical protein n=1 Tax=Xylanimonas oleitrophica TaxID=2607479 RepID=UPI0015D0B4CC|nr:hypothetical protein [Xylanimonas oleitrophica]